MKKSKKAFPNAKHRIERSPGLWSIYYDGCVSSLDVMDAQECKGSSIFARNLSYAFGKDLVDAGCNVTAILNDPSEAECFKWACDGVDVAAVLHKNAGLGIIDDLKNVHFSATKKIGKRAGSIRVFTAGDNGYEPFPGTLSYYVLKYHD